ncbi:hypothetical protein DESC_480120 [Desulfosarcina cetonica]|nr:hypothetical protein DESC_480120 [Desulfosarcina cetonica]
MAAWHGRRQGDGLAEGRVVAALAHGGTQKTRHGRTERQGGTVLEDGAVHIVHRPGIQKEGLDALVKVGVADAQLITEKLPDGATDLSRQADPLLHQGQEHGHGRGIDDQFEIGHGEFPKKSNAGRSAVAELPVG